MTTAKVDGYYVMGRYTSVAWYPAHQREQAEKVAEFLSQYGGADFKVEPDYRRSANVSIKTS